MRLIKTTARFIITALLLFTVDPFFAQDSLKTKKSDQPIDQKSFLNGQKDADNYYGCRKCGTTGTAVTTVFGTAVLGLIPAITCSKKIPLDKNLVVPDKNLLNNQSYMAGYRLEALKIKKKKIWTAFAIGCAVNVVTGLLFFSH